MAQDRPEFADRSARCPATEKSGQRDRRSGGRPRDPSDQRAARRFLSRTRASRSSQPWRNSSKSVQEFSRDLVRWTARLDFPSMEHDYEFVALRHASEYPMNEGRLVSNRGMDIAMDQFAEHFEEYQVPYSNAFSAGAKGAAPISSVRWPAGTCVRTRPAPKSSSSPARRASPGRAAILMSASWRARSKRRMR